MQCIENRPDSRYVMTRMGAGRPAPATTACRARFDSRFVFSWPQSQISVMGAEQAANTLVDVKVRQLAKQERALTQEQIDAIRELVLAEFKRKQSAYGSTSEICDDGSLDPVDTRTHWASRCRRASTRRSPRRATGCSGCRWAPTTRRARHACHTSPSGARSSSHHLDTGQWSMRAGPQPSASISKRRRPWMRYTPKSARSSVAMR